MVHGNLVGMALVAVLAERFVLDRRIGTAPYSSLSTKLGRRLRDASVVLAFLVFGAIGAWALNAFGLTPFGAAWCLPLAFVAVLLVMAVAGEAVLGRWWPRETLNRILTRALILSSILGIMALLPWAGRMVSLWHTITIAARTGVTFVVVRIFYEAVREGIVRCGGRQPGSLLARELAVAALIALACAGISTVNFFG